MGRSCEDWKVMHVDNGADDKNIVRCMRIDSAETLTTQLCKPKASRPRQRVASVAAYLLGTCDTNMA